MDKFTQSIAAQQKRILQALRLEGSKGISTIQLREELDVMSPAPRIFELRKLFKHNIQTIKRIDVNAQGHKHQCAYYVLLAGEWKEGEKKKTD